jgi:hypothetical protein
MTIKKRLIGFFDDSFENIIVCRTTFQSHEIISTFTNLSLEIFSFFRIFNEFSSNVLEESFNIKINCANDISISIFIPFDIEFELTSHHVSAFPIHGEGLINQMPLIISLKNFIDFINCSSHN